MMKAEEMNQNRQHKKATIQERLRSLNISTQPPKDFTKRRCKVNLKDFKTIQNSFVIDVDEEINKEDSKIECKGKRCDFLLWSGEYFVLIEAKSGRADNHTIRQFKDTISWLKRKRIVLEDYKLLLVGKIAEEQIDSFRKEDVLRCNCGDNIHRYLNKR